MTPIGIGASQLAAACGLDPWCSPLRLWCELTGRAEPFIGNGHTVWGQLLEPLLRSQLDAAVAKGEELRPWTATELQQVFNRALVRLVSTN